MGFIKRMFASKEVKAALGVLDEAEHIFEDQRVFSMVKKHIEAFLYKEPNLFVKQLKDQKETPRSWVYSWIANISGDIIASGRFHFYRGAMLHEGYDMLKIYDMAVEELVRIKAIDKKRAKKEKEALLKQIEGVG